VVREGEREMVRARRWSRGERKGGEREREKEREVRDTQGLMDRRLLTRGRENRIDSFVVITV
jgi:hypothetical protein